ncbi:unnamed protein product [Albugo candida]|uniref:Uncharacterized protein n=1 Tax=Albugo candida TaxID=65357 RepID=A0A024FUM1_9STRA|nr:unnamed protein product [Albugo candida]|eukprot:CCI10848.1 unnamed protein product [Albugo candida]
MCTRQSQLFLMLVEVMIHVSNGKDECFLLHSTRCRPNQKPSKAFKNYYQFSLDSQNYATYHCDHSFYFGDSDLADRKINLAPGGVGENCDNFEYRFHKEQLSLTITQTSWTQPHIESVAGT